MKRAIESILIWTFVFIISFAIIAIGTNAISRISVTSSKDFLTEGKNNDSESESGLRMPDGMGKLAQNPAVQWMAGIWVSLSEYEQQWSSENLQSDTYKINGREVNARVVIQNGLNQSQAYYMIILADGIPTAFDIDGDSYTKYPLLLSNQQTELDVKMEPEFCENIGRLDFLLFYDEDPLSDYHMTSYTVKIIQNESEKTPLVPDPLCGTVVQRNGLQGLYTDGAYNAWLWEDNYVVLENDSIGSRELLINNNHSFLFEAVASKPGMYRTILLLDGVLTPFTYNGNVYRYCDWVSKEEEMLQLPIQIDLEAAKSVSFYTVSVPLDLENISPDTMASAKIQLIKNDGKG